LGVEGAVRPTAVGVVVLGVASLHANRGCLSEGAEVKRIDDTPLVALAADELAHGSPDSDRELHLVAAVAGRLSNADLIDRFEGIFNGYERALAYCLT